MIGFRISKALKIFSELDFCAKFFRNCLRQFLIRSFYSYKCLKSVRRYGFENVVCSKVESKNAFANEQTGESRAGKMSFVAVKKYQTQWILNNENV